MNDIVKTSVDSRKQAIYNSYEIEGSPIEKEIKYFFEELEKYASKYNDVMDFENAFQSSDLNTRYINLFSEIASKCKPKVIESSQTSINSDNVTNEVVSDMKYVADELTMPARRQARQQVDDTLRSTPIIGDVMEVKQHIDLFNKFKKHKDIKEDKEEE